MWDEKNLIWACASYSSGKEVPIFHLSAIYYKAFIQTALFTSTLEIVLDWMT